MSRNDVLEKIIECGIVAVIRTDSAEDLIDVAKALKEGGVTSIEITMTIPSALEALPKVKKEVGNEVIMGVGTVLDPETARLAILGGAEFVVSPILNKEIINLCHRYDKIAIPGAYTPTEILTAWEEGADVVKLFPADTLGPKYIKAIHGPMPYVKISPTGGVSLENAGEFIKAGACFVGVGGNLVDKKVIAERKFEILTERAKQYVEEIKKARSK
ncbi:MAG TPA: bifunctional 4-hydroxy-2-oxoglutarate aldolase/2-dehydro-3-deoxy-phosphogluconate aldolase [Dictyoglomaceae bacterium]|nr:bifunctional 4-hydroxy-2-oxoglutarate aldolase/2-dehydro-3-deoxy-phosphogluconate aldolase [Dictyoglomaceae bacterium]HOL39847.1 bifunctional 4-hydroxy-2-oxoglutarate aldolase/2-dehydro-3-deoxy-phosphogluconate aldolase [Dictyoglomaceae bacterium]HPP16325.1 bifunctional 4-hydroxy-2-oxoglutarate aldolase/2-dehydro-3-deoxy-phosphogluconate aldolase [Dictyoglomaceae bacterium]